MKVIIVAEILNHIDWWRVRYKWWCFCGFIFRDFSRANWMLLELHESRRLKVELLKGKT